MIGFYDSGLGGVTILNQMEEISPATALLYFSDTNSCPLGEKSEEEIHTAVKRGVEFLFAQGCTVVVLACNTATVTSIRKLQGNWLKQYPGKNVLGVVRPISEYLLEDEVDKQDTIAVLATPVTINSGFYTEELQDAGYTNIVDIACPGLALAIEQGDEAKQNELLSGYFSEVNVSAINQLVLACTHYPIIKDRIKAAFIEAGGNSDVTVYCQSEIVPEKLIDYLVRHPEYELSGQGIEIFTTGNPEDFHSKVKNIFDLDVPVKAV